jgi:hypothetical protein
MRNSGKSLFRGTLLALMFLAVCANGAESMAQSSPTLVGVGVTQFLDGIGQADGLFSFTFNVTNLGDTSVSKHLSSQTILLSSQGSTAVGGIDQTSTSLINIQCLQTSGNVAWWSGTVFFFTPDPRVNTATNTQILNDVSLNTYVIGGKIISGVPEERSLFLSGANVPEVSLNDAGSINSVSVSILGTSGTSFCKLNDAMFAGNADFLQLNTVTRGNVTSRNCVTGQLPRNRGVGLCDIQWLDPSDTISEGVAPNTPATFSNPPAASIYDLSGVTRDFVAGSVVIGP